MSQFASSPFVLYISFGVACIHDVFPTPCDRKCMFRRCGKSTGTAISTLTTFIWQQPRQKVSIFSLKENMVSTLLVSRTHGTLLRANAVVVAHVFSNKLNHDDALDFDSLCRAASFCRRFKHQLWAHCFGYHFRTDVDI